LYIVPRLVKETRDLDSLPDGNIITIKSVILMGINAPICYQIIFYSPKNMIHHLKEKHNLSFEPACDKIQVYFDDPTRLFDNNKSNQGIEIKKRKYERRIEHSK